MRQGNPHAGWRHYLKTNEAHRVRQLDAEIERAIQTVVAPLKAERQRLATRAHMRMIRANRAEPDPQSSAA